MNKSVVLIPTYNEADSVVQVVKNLTALDIDIMIIDDNSPDGTASKVKSLNLNNVFVVDHGRKNGIGPAYLDGMRLALTQHYQKIATMDADGSHSVDDLKKMLATSRSTDVVLGTRWAKGGSVENWSIHRILLSKFGNWYARKSLGLNFTDLTGGLRIYDKQALSQVNLSSIKSNGYCFQIEIIRALTQLNVGFTEVPINFVERRKGKSKMSRSIVLEAFLRISTWGVQRILGINADKLHYVK